MNKFLSTCLSAFVVLSVFGSVSYVYAKTNDNGLLKDGIQSSITISASDWKSGYKEYISTVDEEYLDESTFDLVEINNDDIPELVVRCNDGKYGDQVLTYKDGKIYVLKLEKNALNSYKKDKNVLAAEVQQDGYYYNSIYKIGENGFEVVLNGAYTDDYSLGDVTFYIDGDEVDQSTYTKSLKSAYDISDQSIKSLIGDGEVGSLDEKANVLSEIDEY